MSINDSFYLILDKIKFLNFITQPVSFSLKYNKNLVSIYSSLLIFLNENRLKISFNDLYNKKAVGLIFHSLDY